VGYDRNYFLVEKKDGVKLFFIRGPKVKNKLRLDKCDKFGQKCFTLKKKLFGALEKLKLT